MALTNARRLKDINALITQALPATGATVTSSSLDLGTTTAFRIPGIELQLAVPATPNLVDGKNVTFTVQHSPDNGTTAFGAVPGVAPLTITGAGRVGSPAVGDAPPYKMKLPLGLLRYLRVVAVADAGAGNSTAVSFTFGPVF